MGVVRNKNRSRSDSQCLEFHSELADLFFDQSDDNREEENNNSHLLLELDSEVQTDIKKKKSAPRNVRRSRPEPMFRGLGCRGKGRKRFQRYENGNLLVQSIAHTFGGLEIDDLIEDLNIYDFSPRTVSAFARIMMAEENMIAWYDFIALSDEEQRAFLAKHSR